MKKLIVGMRVLWRLNNKKNHSSFLSILSCLFFLCLTSEPVKIQTEKNIQAKIGTFNNWLGWLAINDMGRQITLIRFAYHWWNLQKKILLYFPHHFSSIYHWMNVQWLRPFSSIVVRAIHIIWSMVNWHIKFHFNINYLIINVLNFFFRFAVFLWFSVFLHRMIRNTEPEENVPNQWQSWAKDEMKIILNNSNSRIAHLWMREWVKLKTETFFFCFLICKFYVFLCVSAFFD